MGNDKTAIHEYLPILGLESLSTAATKILLGEDHPVIKEGRVCYMLYKSFFLVNNLLVIFISFHLSSLFFII